MTGSPGSTSRPFLTFPGSRRCATLAVPRASLSIEVARRHPNLRCISIYLRLSCIAQRHIAAAGLAERVTTAAGDFFKDPAQGGRSRWEMILPDWNLGRNAI